MSSNKLMIEKFYSSFQRLDYAGMNDCYAEDVVFNDPVFGILHGDEARSMWEMLCKSAKDFTLSFGDIQLLDDEYATCQWTATYTFSRTGRKVINHIKAHMRIKDGKIIEHSDAFKLSRWMPQALGLPGILFGWTGFMKRKVQQTARRNLIAFMSRK